MCVGGGQDAALLGSGQHVQYTFITSSELGEAHLSRLGQVSGGCIATLLLPECVHVHIPAVEWSVWFVLRNPKQHVITVSNEAMD